MKFIHEDEVEEALDYLRDSATAAAEAKANRIYMERWREVVKAQIMAEHNEQAVNAQEKYALADARYIKCLEALRKAVFEDTRHGFKREASRAMIDAWRTQTATERAMAL